jgi:RimJ/RimL family protein N-acetyltransferase
VPLWRIIVRLKIGGLKVAVLQTNSLTLSPCCPGDCEDFIELELDPQVMRFLNGGQAVDHRQSNPEATFLMPRGTEEHVWTARRRANGAFVGWFCLWPEGDRVAELGYRLRRMEWGQGFGSEGAAALANWGFKSAGYDRIVACAMAANLASRRVMEKIGMTYVRTEPPDGPVPVHGTKDAEVWYEMRRAACTGL